MNVEPVIQIAGVKDLGEALMLWEAGVTQLGFPLRLDFHTPDTSEEEARDIIRALPAEVGKALITYLSEPTQIAELAAFLGVDIVQLHGRITVEAVWRLRAQAKGLTIIKSLIVTGEDDADALRVARSLADSVDFFLTDTYDPVTGASGATGKTHDWRVSERLAREAGRPLILAGGLNPRNVRRAISEVKPAGVDAHTGVEGADGRKDRRLVEEFVREGRRGFAEMAAHR
jgi:phosphoribosylanthranilate isomerase